MKLFSGNPIWGTSAATIAGIALTFLFQILIARLLPPSEYGLVATFLAIINIAAIGAAALQNSVTVNVAKSKFFSNAESIRYKNWFQKLDPTTKEAGLLGFVGLFLIAGFCIPIADALSTSPLVVLLAAITFPMSFFISRDLGILQGNEKPAATVGWSTLSSLIRLFLVGFLVLLIPTGNSAIFGIFSALTFTLAILSIQVSKLNHKSTHRPFGIVTISVVGASIAFAWLTNVDVIFVRALCEPLSAGEFSAAATLIKSTLIIPGTISIIILPKLVHQGKNVIFGKQMLSTICISGGAVLFLALILWFQGVNVMKIIVGENYTFTNTYLSLMAISFVPWVINQALLIKLNAVGTIQTLGLLTAIVVLQIAVMLTTLPDIMLMIILNGIVGLLTFFLLLGILGKIAKRA